MKRDRYYVRPGRREGPHFLPWRVVDRSDGQVMKSGLGWQEAWDLAELLNTHWRLPWWKRIFRRRPRPSLDQGPGAQPSLLSNSNTYQKLESQGGMPK
jgi:hypothetical protein